MKQGNKFTGFTELKNSKTTLKTILREDDEPVACFVFESGWTSPRKYHVILEYGDYEATDYMLLTAEEIIEMFGIDPEK